MRLALAHSDVSFILINLQRYVGSQFVRIKLLDNIDERQLAVMHNPVEFHFELF